jgi:hypothetical protein
VVVAEREHPSLEQRIVVDRQQAGLVRPVLEDLAAPEERRDARLVVRADSRRERQAVRAVDGCDRVELDGLEAADLGRDVALRRAPKARGEALVRDDVAAERRDRGDACRRRSQDVRALPARPSASPT